MTTRTDEARMEHLLDDALAAGVIDAEVHHRLAAFVHERARVVEAAARRPAGAPAAPPLGATPPPRSMLARPYPTMPAHRPTPPRHGAVPSPVSSWVGAFRKAVVSDVAVHGLAYLGVLLLFAGTLGFFLFSFGSLSMSARPWAELAIPTVLLGSAVFLRRRGAPVVATAVGIVGGVLLPVVLFASYVDGVAFPPDLQGRALGLGVIVTSLVLACAYALVAARWRDVSVRHLVAPMLWTALFGVGILLPGAQSATLKDWTAGQFALVAFGVAATALVIRVRPSWHFSLDSAPAVIPGALVSLALVLLFAGTSGWPGWPLTLTGLAMLSGTEAFAERLGERLTQVLQPPFLWLAAAGIGQSIGKEIAGPVLVVASLATLEWQMRRRPGGVPAFANSVGAIGGLSVTLGSPTPEPWAAVAATLPVAAWAHARRMRRPSWLTDGDALILVMTVAVIASTGVGAAVLGAMSDIPAFLVLGATLVLVALATRRYRAEDVFLRWWTLGSAMLLGVTVVVWPSIAHSAEALVLALSTLTVVATPGAVRTRAWVAASGVAAASSAALLATGLNEDTASFVVAAVACGAAGVLTWSAHYVVSHLSAACWTVAVISTAVLAAFAHRILPTESNLWLLAIGMGVLTSATASAAVAFEWRHRGAALQLAHLLEASAHEATIPVLPPMLVLLGLAGTALAACDAAGLVRTQPGTVTVVLATLALVESGGTHLFVDHVKLRGTIGVGAFALEVVAALAALPYLHASAATLALLITLVVLIRGDARLEVMTATAWAASGLLAFRAGQLVEVAERDLPLVVAAWAAAVGLGALGADDMLAGRRSAGMFVRTRALLAPAVFGLATFTPALVLGMVDSSDPRIAWLALAGAVAFAAAALLLRLGAMTVGTWILLSVSALLWSPWAFADEPVIGVGWAAALGAVALALHLWEPTSKTDGQAAHRWDIPPMAVGTATTVVALGIAAQIEEIAITWTFAGALALATAFVLRSRLAAGIGAVLVVIGAIDAGHGWAALALGGAAAGLALIAVHEFERPGRSDSRSAPRCSPPARSSRSSSTPDGPSR